MNSSLRRHFHFGFLTADGSATLPLVGAFRASPYLRLLGILLAVTACGFPFPTAAWGQEALHRATRLGHPETRFADPLKRPEDLQAMLRSEALRSDVDYIARESGFRGNMADLRQAADVRNIRPLKIPVGKRLPAMSTRKDGKAVLLREVLWAGKEPIDAYEFDFVSNGRRYLVIAPKACANFWVEDRGPVLRAELALRCDAATQVVLGRSAQVCLTLKNTGNATEPRAVLTLPVPAGATFLSATGGGRLEQGAVVWEWQNLLPGASQEVCVEFETSQIGSLAFDSTAGGSRSPQVQSHCGTRMVGIPAVLLEVVDLSDPIEVGGEQTYEITVLNQGSAVLTNLKLACTFEPSQQFVSGTGPTTIRGEERSVVFEGLPLLAPKETAVWKVVVKALEAGDVRFLTELTCDQFARPITETESTTQY